MTRRSECLEEYGLDSEKVELLLNRVQLEVDKGLLPGVQVALARYGKVAVLESYGTERPGYGSAAAHPYGRVSARAFRAVAMAIEN